MTAPQRAFVHRTNDNGTIHSICPHCYNTVATSIGEAELEFAEHRWNRFVDLHKRLYALCRHVTRFMALLARRLSEEMWARRGSHPDHLNFHVGGESKELTR